MEKFNFDTSEDESAELAKEKPESAPSGRFKRFVHSAMAAATLLGTLPSEKAAAAEPQDTTAGNPKIENVGKHEMTKIEKHSQEVNEWLNEFDNPEITFGEHHSKTRSFCEKLGIYYKGVYVDDLTSEGTGSALFEEDSFKDLLNKLLEKHGVPHKNVPKPELVIGNGVIEKIAELGMIVGYKTNEKGKRVMTLSANTQNPDKSKAVYYELCMDDDGRPDSFARLELTENDKLVLRGKDDELFEIEFERNKFGEIIVIEK